jgi:polyphosphate:AMP phosphotransferase
VFEAAELGSKISKSELDAQLPELRVNLINAQYDLRSADFPVMIVLIGDDRPGVSELVNRLNEWMDARYIRTHVFEAFSDAELQRPRNWRYWSALPGQGQLAIYTGAFALETIAERLEGAIDDAEFDHRLEHMARFEQALRDDGALILKFWIHLPKKAFKKRINRSRKKLGDGGRLDKADHRIFEAYDNLMPLAAHVLRKTDAAGGPWHIVEGTQARHRDLTVASIIHSALLERLRRPTRPEPPPARTPRLRPGSTVLDAVDLTAGLARPEYREKRNALQARLRELTLRARDQGVSSVVVLEGWDAAGKGGVIRRMSQAMDVQDYRIVPIAAPTHEELAHHYLWRFWRQLPRAGRMLIFDRSWYGRVLVERVSGLSAEAAWRRAYVEINDFEEQILERGIPLFKFWLHMDREEQFRRFREREGTPYKKYKITEEDYRNRESWDDYVSAVNEMVQRTSTDVAPWTLVPANDKRFARVEVLRTVCDGMATRLS